MSYQTGVGQRTAVVTGAASPRGIGFATAGRYAQEGWAVALLDIDEQGIKTAEQRLREQWDIPSIGIGVDVTDRSQVRAMVAKAVESFGALDVIFNNAGMNRPRDFMEVDEENFDEIVRVNAWGIVVCTQEAAKQMIAQGSGGKIVNTGSIASRQGFWDFVPYCVAKFGVLAITQATARGLIEHGITVNAFAPGVVDTPMWIGLNEDIRTIHDQPAPPTSGGAVGRLRGESLADRGRPLISTAKNSNAGARPLSLPAAPPRGSTIKADVANALI